MNYRRLGRSGLKVSEICLGAWIGLRDPIDDAATSATLDVAVEEGINFFDLADIYAHGRAEEGFARWLKGKDRRTFVIASKCRGEMWDGPNGQGASRKHIMDACDDSLRRLQTDYIDLYQIHSPDPETLLEETLRALDDLVHSGKVRYIGCSNFDSEMIGEAARIAERYNLHKFISSQPRYSMLDRGIEARDVPRCAQEGLGIIAYSPLAQGLLSDKYLDGTIPQGSRGEGNEGLQEMLQKNLSKLQALGAFAKARDLTLSQLALVWLLHQPAVAAPITGASRPEQVRENAKASGVKLSTADLAEIETILA